MEGVLIIGLVCMLVGMVNGALLGYLVGRRQ